LNVCEVEGVVTPEIEAGRGEREHVVEQSHISRYPKLRILAAKGNEASSVTLGVRYCFEVFFQGDVTQSCALFGQKGLHWRALVTDGHQVLLGTRVVGFTRSARGG